MPARSNRLAFGLVGEAICQELPKKIHFYALHSVR